MVAYLVRGEEDMVTLEQPIAEQVAKGVVFFIEMENAGIRIACHDCQPQRFHSLAAQRRVTDEYRLSSPPSSRHLQAGNSRT